MAVRNTLILLYSVVICALVAGVRVPVAAPVDDPEDPETSPVAGNGEPHQQLPPDVPVETLRILLSRLSDRHASATSEQAMCRGLADAVHGALRHALAMREQAEHVIAQRSEGGGGEEAVDALRLAVAQLMRTMHSSGVLAAEDDHPVGSDDASSHGGHVRVSDAFAERVRIADAACLGSAMELLSQWLHAHPTPSAEATGTEEESIKTSLEVLERHFNPLQQQDAAVASTPVSELRVHEVLSILLPVLEKAIADITAESSTDNDGAAGGEASSPIHRGNQRAANAQQVFSLFGIAQRMIHDHSTKVQVAAAAAQALRLVIQDIATEADALQQQLSSGEEEQQQRVADDSRTGMQEEEETVPASFSGDGNGDALQRRANADLHHETAQRSMQAPDAETIRKIIEAVQATAQGGLGNARVTINGMPLNIGDPPAAVAAAPPDPSQLMRRNTVPPPSAASAPVDAAWLTRNKVELGPNGDASQPGSGLRRCMPLPYHSTMRPLLPEGAEPTNRLGDDAHRSLCTQAFVASAPDVYPGILVLTAANILPVTTLVDEALLFVYRDWDATVEAQLHVLNRSFPEVEHYIVPQRVSSDDGGDRSDGDDDGCVLTMRRGLFHDAYDAAFPASAATSTEPDGPRSSKRIEDPRCGKHRRGLPSWRVARPFVRLAHGEHHPDDAQVGLQTIMAVNLGRDGGMLPFLNDLTNPGLYFLQKRMLGPGFVGPWSAAAVRRFVFESIEHSIVLASHYQLHRVLQTVETAIVIMVHGAAPVSEDPPTHQLSKMLAAGANNLRLALGAACGLVHCPVHVLAPDTVLDDAPDRWAIPTAASHQRSSTAVPENPFLTHYAELTLDAVRWPHLPRDQWRQASSTLRTAEQSSTTVVVFRKLKDSMDEDHLGTHALTAMAFPSPTARTPREAYARQVGGALIQFVKTKSLQQQPYVSLVEDPLTAVTFSQIIRQLGLKGSQQRRRTSALEWMLLLVNTSQEVHHSRVLSAAVAPHPTCLAALRGGAIQLRDRAPTQPDGASAVEEAAAARGGGGAVVPNRVLFGVVHQAAQAGFVDELYRSAHAVLPTAANASLLSAHGRKMVRRSEGSRSATVNGHPAAVDASETPRKRYVSMVGRRGEPSSTNHGAARPPAGCAMVAVHVPTGRIEWYQRVALEHVALLPQWLIEPRRRAPAQLLRVAQERWKRMEDAPAVDSDVDGAASGFVDASLASDGFAEWRLTVAGKRQYPILQRRRAPPPPPAATERHVDMVLLYDARCARSMPAVLGFEQVRRCKELIAAGDAASPPAADVHEEHQTASVGDAVPRGHRALQQVMRGVSVRAYDVANISTINAPEWVLPVVEMLGHTDEDGASRTSVPMLVVGNDWSHTVTMPSSWAWQGYARTYLTVLQAEYRQRQKRAETDGDDHSQLTYSQQPLVSSNGRRCDGAPEGGEDASLGCDDAATRLHASAVTEADVDRGLMECLWHVHRTDKAPLIRRFRRVKRGGDARL